MRYGGDPIPADTVAPTISNLRTENVSGSSFDIVCDLSDNVGVTRVWLIIYAPNGETQFGVPASNGEFRYTIRTSEYGGEGEYAVGFYAFDAEDNGTAVYYKKSSDTSWKTKQSYSSNTNVSIKPASKTKYDVSVKVKDSLGNVSKQAFTITVK